MIAPGARLGPYEITAKLGEGGMGEVWRAHDTKLERDVAIKVLPAAFTEDAERLARFEREAKLLAQLHHPNIASIFGMEESETTQALVMELVEGPTLAERLEQGPLPIDESLSFARQIAEALEEAHEKGIVHRDLKPQNIKASREGKVKVLDFGLAKAMDPTGAASGPGSASQLAASPTLTLGATIQGVILGTAAYMAPEQAKGFAVDRRADIWAFGVVLYEMLVGRSLFAGDSVPDTLARVLQRDIDFDALPASTPPALRQLLRRCLERDPRRRLRDIGEARIQIEAIASGDAGLLEPAVRVEESGLRRSPALLLLAGAALGALVTLAGMAMRGGGSAAVRPERTVKFQIEVPEDADSAHARISPDGRQIAWTAGSALWVRRLDQIDPRRIDLPWSATLQAWADPKTLVLSRRGGRSGELWRVSTEGGAPAPIAALPSEGFLWGVSPGKKGEILFGMAGAGLYSVPASGGAAKQFLPAGENEAFGGPTTLPDGRSLLFAEVNSGRIEVLAGGKRKVVLAQEGERYFDPLYSPSGQLIVRATGGRRAEGFWAVPFSLDRLETIGEPFRILPYGFISISQDGTLLFSEYLRDLTPRRLVEVDRKGIVRRTLGEPMTGLEDPSLSPDGERIAMAARTDATTAAADLFVLDRRSGARFRLQDELGADYRPVWSDGGRSLVFVTYSAGIRIARSRAADGSGEATLLDDKSFFAVESPDGRYLVTSFYDTRYRERGANSWHHLFDEPVIRAAFTPDGRWLAYVDVKGRNAYLRRFPEGDGMIPVSSESTEDLRFSRDGRELFLWQDGSLVSVPVDLGAATPSVGERRPLFDGTTARLDSGSGFDVTPEGTFLMAQSLEEESRASRQPALILIENWASEFTASDGAGEGH